MCYHVHPKNQTQFVIVSHFPLGLFNRELGTERSLGDALWNMGSGGGVDG